MPWDSGDKESPGVSGLTTMSGNSNKLVLSHIVLFPFE